MKSRHWKKIGILILLLAAAAFALSGNSGAADAIGPAGQSPVKSCNATPKPPWCSAVEGDRSQGWLPQSRSEVMARNGMVTTSQPLAAQAGLEILQAGGNAIDAAVAASAVLNVVEPMNVGIAGDLFAIIYIAKENKLYAINASGKAPSGATLARMNSLGYKWDPNNWAPGSGMPSGGILTVTVPGTVWGWDQVLKRFGTMGFKKTLEAAATYAEEGFPVSERISYDWNLPSALGPIPSDPRNCCTQRDPDSITTWFINGVKPAPGQIYRNANLAKTFRILQQKGVNGFYRGEVAEAIVRKSNAVGGTMTLDDLANYRGEWNEPATTSYNGYDLYTLPPPAQTWAAAEIVKILEVCVPVWAPGQTMASLGPTNPTYWHFFVEAKKLAFNDLYAYNADPNFADVPVKRLLSAKHAASLCSLVNPKQASKTTPGANINPGGDTIVLSTADRWGNMVAWVNSNYAGFGSGLTVPGYGFILHNRGGLFTLDPRSPNVIEPHKFPFNTLSASFVMQNKRPLMTITLMGGDMQAQGHAQMFVNILDLGANMQGAADMARFRHNQIPNQLSIESKLYDLVGAQLRAMGHKVDSVNGGPVGGYQSIMFTPDPNAPGGNARGDCEKRPGQDSLNNDCGPIKGFYRSGSDHRKDGQAVGY
jgi:gamma-glutamyltranspeptidase / glutathione hydrolase